VKIPPESSREYNCIVGSDDLVSVVIPAYNNARYLDASVGSVLGQSHTNLECLVIDDGSTDDTADVVRRMRDARLRYVWKENRGTVADARNRGISEARGAFVAFLDADDAWHPEKLAVQLEVLRRRPSVGMVYCAYAITDEALNVRTVVSPDEHDPALRKWLLLEGSGIAASSTAVVRSEVLADAGGYRLELSVSEDLEFAERLARHTEIAAAPECLAYYRTHPTQSRHRPDKYEHDMRWILRHRFLEGEIVDRRSWARGTANLETRLFFLRLRAHQPHSAVAHLAAALRASPSRPFLLPLEAAVRRLRRRRGGAQ
jgi:glycosyltransferase involved in cell wall biosynthesis